MIENDKTKNLSKEEKEDLVHKSKAREIVRTIMDYGVTQSQIVYIISMLSLELEDLNLAREIRNILSQNENFQGASNLPSEEKKKTKIFV